MRYIRTIKFLNLLLIVLATIFFITPLSALAQLADSPWPVLGGNAQHTGLSSQETGKEKKELLWSYKTSGAVESSPIIGADGTVYLGSHDGNLYALSSDGSLKWKFKVADPVYDERWKVSKAIMATPAIAKDGTIYINGASSYLHAVNPDGQEKWRFPIKWSNDFWNGPNIGADGIIYIGTARNDPKDQDMEAGVYAITPEGKEKWRYPEPSGVTIVPTIAVDGTIYAGAAEVSTNKGRIIALDQNGKKKWQFDLEQWLEGSASIGDDGTIYSGSKEGFIYAINPDGSEKWCFKTGSGISAVPSIGPDGTVYIGSWDGNFYAFDQKTGQEKWRFDVKIGRDPKLFEGYPGKETISSSAALSKDGVIIFADVFDTVYALNTDGKELWRWKAEEGGGFASSPSISKDGTIYIGSESNYLYAISGSIKTNVNAENKEIPKNYHIKETVIVISTIILLIIGILVIWKLKLKRKKETPDIKTR